MNRVTDDGSFISALFPDSSRVGRITSDVSRCISVTQFTGAWEIAWLSMAWRYGRGLCIPKKAIAPFKRHAEWSTHGA